MDFEKKNAECKNKLRGKYIIEANRITPFAINTREEQVLLLKIYTFFLWRWFLTLTFVSPKMLFRFVFFFELGTHFYLHKLLRYTFVYRIHAYFVRIGKSHACKDCEFFFHTTLVNILRFTFSYIFKRARARRTHVLSICRTALCLLRLFLCCERGCYWFFT